MAIAIGRWSHWETRYFCSPGLKVQKGEAAQVTSLMIRNCYKFFSETGISESEKMCTKAVNAELSLM